MSEWLRWRAHYIWADSRSLCLLAGTSWRDDKGQLLRWCAHRAVAWRKACQITIVFPGILVFPGYNYGIPDGF